MALTNPVAPERIPLAKRLGIDVRHRIWQLSNRRRLLPGYFVAGAQKAGTTFLHSLLVEHPQVRSAWRKEMHFFDLNYVRGEAWYKAFFPHATGAHEIVGDATPTYMFHPLGPQRMAKLSPDAKIVVVLREPVARAISHYQMMVRQGKETLSFAQAIEDEEKRLSGEDERMVREPNYIAWNWRMYSYKARGVYLPQIKRLEASFPKENILVVESGDLFGRTEDTVAKVVGFLGLDDWRPSRYAPANVSKQKAEVDDGVKEGLRQFYEPHNAELYDHLGWERRW